MDVRDISRALRDYRDSGDWDDWMYRENIQVVPDVGFVRVVEKNPGDWQGDEIFIVFEIEFPDSKPHRFYKIDGTFASFGESSWDEPVYEVRPRTQFVTAFDRVED